MDRRATRGRCAPRRIPAVIRDATRGVEPAGHMQDRTCGAGRDGTAVEYFLHGRGPNPHKPPAKGPPMPKRAQRSQASNTTDDDQRPLVVRPLVQTDRIHNPDDIEVDEAAI